MATVAELKKMSVDELEAMRNKIAAQREALKVEFVKIGRVKAEKLAAPQIVALKERRKAIDANLETLGAA